MKVTMTVTKPELIQMAIDYGLKRFTSSFGLRVESAKLTFADEVEICLTDEPDEANVQAKDPNKIVAL